MSSLTEFGELVLIIGDFHVPFKRSDIPPVFKELLNTDKVKTVLCTGNTCCMEMVDKLRSLAPNVYIVKGDLDQQITDQLPETLVVTVGQFKVGLVHGHQIVPMGEHGAMEIMQRKLGVDILVSGHTHCNEIYQNKVGNFFINPGSVTGAPSPSVVVPSFMLMAVQGPSAAIYTYELVEGNANVVMSEIHKGKILDKK